MLFTVESMHSPATWTFHNPVQITRCCSYLEELPRCLPSEGSLLLVTSRGFTRRGECARLSAALGRQVLLYDDVQPNPELDALDAATARFRGEGISAVIALGGGSAIDSGKVLAVTLKAPADLTLHRLFREKTQAQQWKARLPVIAIPTTSGTGAEVTPFATVWDNLTQAKHSVSGPALFPDHALLDPSLTLSLPVSVTLHAGLDAISHAMESLWNRKSSPVSKPLALQALNQAILALPATLEHPGDLTARSAMQEAATLAGLAISLTQTAIAHSISYPLTSVHGVPHGLACSFTLPALLDFANPALPEGDVRQTLQAAAALVRRLAPASEVLKSVDLSGMEALVDKMFHPERAANFVLPIQRSDVMTILRRSV